MATSTQPSYEINYISQQKRILVGRNNNPITQKFKIDNRIRDTYYFQVVSRNNQIVDLSGFSYQFFGSFIDAKNNQHTLFYSDDYKIEDNVLSFKVNTFNSQYLNYVKTHRYIELTIKKKDDYIEQVILRDTGIAYPTPTYDGEDPSEVVAGFGLEKNGYVLSLTGTVLSGGTDIQIVDNKINYTGPSGSAYTAGSGISIENNVISLTATIPTVPTNVSAFDNDAGYATSSWVDTNYAKKGEAPTDVYTKAEVDTISTALSSAVSGAGYLTEIPDTYALKTDIPTDVATSSYVQSASGNAVTVATGWVNSQNYLTTIPDTYALKTDIPTDYTTSAQVSAIASAYAGSATGDVTSAQVSAIVEGYNYLTGITVSYNDEEWTEHTLSGTGLAFTDMDPVFFTIEESYSDDSIHITWNGIRHTGGVQGIDDSDGIMSKDIWWSTDFSIRSNQGYAQISLANPIPLSTSQLINNSNFQTAAQVSAIASAYAGGNSDITVNYDGNSYTVSALNLVDGLGFNQDLLYWTGLTVGGGAEDWGLGQVREIDFSSKFSLTNQDIGYYIYVDLDETSINSMLQAGILTGYTTPAQVSAIASAYGGGGGTTLSTVYDLLSAGPNITLSKNDSTGITTISGTEGGSPITNKQAKLTIAGDTVQYSPDYEIFETTQNNVVDGVITIQPVANINLGTGEVATFEQWIVPSATITGFAFDSSYQFLGELPSSFTANAIQVFTVRLLNSQYGIKQYISYAYQFDNPMFTPLTFTGKSATNAIKLTQVNSPDAITLKYSKNGGEWTDYTINNIISLANGDTVAFSGANDHFSKNDSNSYYFQMTGSIEADGNVQSLVNFSDTCSGSCFIYLFNYCTSLVKAPALPATTLGDNCYKLMFQNCSNLTAAPQILPATTLASYCYKSMFEGCSKISSAPALPATTLAPYCYQGMFNGCSSLSTTPTVLPATTLANYCYQSMFKGCSNLTVAPYLPATTLVNNCYKTMFQDCTKLSSISVEFSSWDNRTGDWLKNVAATGTFTCPTALGTNETISRGYSNCPENWTVINK